MRKMSRNFTTVTYNNGGDNNMLAFYVRCLVEKIPEEKKEEISFKDDKNYPVLGVDPQGKKILVPDDKNRMLWLPNDLFRFVKLG